jgi:G protein-coupled receptor GPR1
MLLIQSDLIKSLWFVIFPIVDYTHGPIASDSAFCQVSGFFLALGIESSDVAVLLITLHSALYILRPQSGLSPYRRYAYALYVVVPLLVASLAFVGGRGYENSGPYCYLETGPGWERLALSWIPRYVIFIIILVTYACIYAYVRSMMVNYGKGHQCSFGQDCPGDRCTGSPPTPTIERHGLVGSAPSSLRRADVRERDGRPSISSTNTITATYSDGNPDSNRDTYTPRAEQDGHPVGRVWPGFTPSMPTQNRRSPGKVGGTLSPASDSLEPPQQHHSTSKSNSIDGLSSLSSTIRPPQSTWSGPLSPPIVRMADYDALISDTTMAEENNDSIQTSLPGMLSPTRKDPPRRRERPSTLDILAPGAIQDSSEIARNREKILRQLRSLFVYPLAYMLTWIFPFVRHVRGFDGDKSDQDPYWLFIVCMVSLTMQGAVDSTVFTIREEPWKHTQGGFWETFNRRLHDGWKKGWSKARVVGRTSEEMVVDGRNARARRKEEMAAERVVRGTQDTAAGSRGVRDWWDVGFEGSGGEGEEEEGERGERGTGNGGGDTFGNTQPRTTVLRTKFTAGS